MARKLYRVDVKIAATAYVWASSRAAAQDLAVHDLKDATFEVDDGEAGEVTISGEAYDLLEPETAVLSPAMTVLSIGRAQLAE